MRSHFASALDGLRTFRCLVGCLDVLMCGCCASRDRACSEVFFLTSELNHNTGQGKLRCAHAFLYVLVTAVYVFMLVLFFFTCKPLPRDVWLFYPLQVLSPFCNVDIKTMHTFRKFVHNKFKEKEHFRFSTATKGSKPVARCHEVLKLRCKLLVLQTRCGGNCR